MHLGFSFAIYFWFTPTLAKVIKNVLLHRVLSSAHSSFVHIRTSVLPCVQLPIESGLVRVPSIDVGTSLTTVIDLATTCQILSMPYSKLLADCHPKRRMKAFKDQFLWIRRSSIDLIRVVRTKPSGNANFLGVTRNRKSCVIREGYDSQ